MITRDYNMAFLFIVNYSTCIYIYIFSVQYLFKVVIFQFETNAWRELDTYTEKRRKGERELSGGTQSIYILVCTR